MSTILKNDRRSRGVTHALLDASGNRRAPLLTILIGPAGHRMNSDDAKRVKVRECRIGICSEPITANILSVLILYICLERRPFCSETLGELRVGRSKSAEYESADEVAEVKTGKTKTP
jgi:hypothetical protein